MYLDQVFINLNTIYHNKQLSDVIADHSSLSVFHNLYEMVLSYPSELLCLMNLLCLWNSLLQRKFWFLRTGSRLTFSLMVITYLFTYLSLYIYLFWHFVIIYLFLF